MIYWGKLRWWRRDHKPGNTGSLKKRRTPGQLPAEKWGPQSYNRMKLIWPTIWINLEVDSFPNFHESTALPTARFWPWGLQIKQQLSPTVLECLTYRNGDHKFILFSGAEVKWQSLSHVCSLWSMDCIVHGILQAEYWSGYPFPSPGDLPNPGIKPRSSALWSDSLSTELQGKPFPVLCCGNLLEQQEKTNTRIDYYVSIWLTHYLDNTLKEFLLTFFPPEF